jgi:hypothetical protein
MCKEFKNLAEFHNNKTSKDGHAMACKKCACATSQQWRKDSPEWAKELCRIWQKNNPIRKNELARKSWAKRVDILKERRRTSEKRFIKEKNRLKEKWFLTFDEWYALIGNNICHYCHGPLHDSGTALDRKDNTKFYILDNVVPCCIVCNRMKNQYISYEEMVLIWELRRLNNTHHLQIKGVDQHGRLYGLSLVAQ